MLEEGLVDRKKKKEKIKKKKGENKEGKKEENKGRKEGKQLFINN